jgi:hypothetical protein
LAAGLDNLTRACAILSLARESSPRRRVPARGTVDTAISRGQKAKESERQFSHRDRMHGTEKARDIGDHQRQQANLRKLPSPNPHRPTIRINMSISRVCVRHRSRPDHERELESSNGFAAASCKLGRRPSGALQMTSANSGGRASCRLLARRAAGAPKQTSERFTRTTSLLTVWHPKSTCSLL